MKLDQNNNKDREIYKLKVGLIDKKCADDGMKKFRLNLRKLKLLTNCNAAERCKQVNCLAASFSMAIRQSTNPKFDINDKYTRVQIHM